LRSKTGIPSPPHSKSSRERKRCGPKAILTDVDAMVQLLFITLERTNSWRGVGKELFGMKGFEEETNAFIPQLEVFDEGSRPSVWCS
jgi:hypothetical protein